MLPLARGFADSDNHVKILSEAVGMVTSRITSVEQTVNAVFAKMALLQQWNGTSTPLQKMSTRSLHAYARLKRMQRSSPVVPTRQDRGTYLDIVTVPQPLGPGSQGRLMTVEIQGVDLILSQALRMNMHEVPSYYGSLVNNTTLELQSGSIIFGKNQICQLTMSLSEFIAKQVLRRAGLYLKYEPNVKTLLLDIKTMVFPFAINSPFCCTNTTITVRQSRQLKTERLENNLRPCGKKIG